MDNIVEFAGMNDISQIGRGFGREYILRGLMKELMDAYTSDMSRNLVSWKGESDKLFGPAQAIEVWQLLKDRDFIPDAKDDLVFVSLSGNKVSHELAIYKYECMTRLGSKRFLVSDLIPINRGHVLHSLGENRFAEFNIIRSDGFMPPLKNESVDVVWSRKGELWYAARYEKGYADFGDLTREVFKNIARIIKPGGILVIDAIEGFGEYYLSLDPNRKHVQSDILALRYPNAPHQYEYSTVDMINIADPRLWELAQEEFDIFDIGYEATRVRALKKKTNT